MVESLNMIARDPQGSLNPTPGSMQDHLQFCVSKGTVQTLLEIWQALVS